MTGSKVHDFDIKLDAKSLLEEVGKESVEELVQNSPKRNEAYAKAWTYKYSNGKIVIFNDGHGQLTHLLENGHLTVLKKGKGKRRTKPKPHIRKVYEDISNKIEKKKNLIVIKSQGGKK